MSPFALPLVVPLALALGAPLWPAPPDPAGELVTAAAASARPSECSARAQSGRAPSGRAPSGRAPSGRAPSVWERARTPQRAAFCAAIARAHARLGTDPEGAEAAAARAEEAWPGRAATRIALARARLGRGDVKGALAAFDEAQTLDARAVADPGSLRDLARALALGGQRAPSLAAYRALVPQSSLLPRETQAAVLVEASLAAMAAPRDAGPAADAAVAEGLAFLREARAIDANPLVAETALVLALALDRAGDPTGASAQLLDATRLGASRERAAALATDAADGLALGALLGESGDRAAAAALWDRYLAEVESAAYRGAAERRRDALRSGARPTSAKATPAKAGSERRAPRR